MITSILLIVSLFLMVVTIVFSCKAESESTVMGISAPWAIAALIAGSFAICSAFWAGSIKATSIAQQEAVKAGIAEWVLVVDVDGSAKTELRRKRENREKREAKEQKS